MSNKKRKNDPFWVFIHSIGFSDKSVFFFLLKCSEQRLVGSVCEGIHVKGKRGKGNVFFLKM